jgi:hypothetical protein
MTQNDKPVLLMFDHFFDQDLKEIESYGASRYRLVRIPAIRFRKLASQIFPEQAFGDLGTAYGDDMLPHWQRYETLVNFEARWLVACYSPSLFIVPSDVFFYVRPLIAALKLLNVKTLVVQKETTITDFTMKEHAQEIEKWTPFMSDFMTVCSQRQKDFWVLSGANQNRIAVTGQPRFDFYLRPQATRRERDRPRLLYLSFDDVAYLPGDLGHENTDTWRAFRQELEETISEFVDFYEIVVKKHPQQQPSQTWLHQNITEARRDQDTRALILKTDVVLAFQTTGAYEGIVAGKQVIYPAWGDVYERNLDGLIRYDLDPELFHHVKSKDELRMMLHSPGQLAKINSAGTKKIEQTLGSLDGHATSRLYKYIDSLRNPPTHVAISFNEYIVRLTQNLFILVFLTLAKLTFLGNRRLMESFHWRLTLRRDVCREAYEIIKSRKVVWSPTKT